MELASLTDFLRWVEAEGSLRRVPVEVDPVLEIAAVTDRVCKGAGGGPVLLFEKVKGHPFPAVTNLFGSPSRTARALGGASLEEISLRLEQGLARQGEGPAFQRLRRLVEAPQYIPRRVERAPCQEIAGAENLLHLPALQNWPGDAGRFLTLPQVFTRDPDTGRPNCGIYRMQIYDNRSAGMHWGKDSDAARHAAAWARRGEDMPVAVALGGPPALTYAAAAPLPPEVEESAFAGWLAGTPVETVRCLTSDLEVPAEAEFVLEGYVAPGESRPEGPFGNHTGFYAPAAPSPVFHLLRLSRRNGPILPCTVVGAPPMENLQLARATERLFLPVLQIDHPEITGVHFLAEGAFHGCALVSVRPEAAGRGLDIVGRLWRSGMLRHARLLVTIDADLEPNRRSEVLWRAINQVDPSRDLLTESGRLGIDATEKGGRPRVSADDGTLRSVCERWEEYGID